MDHPDTKDRARQSGSRKPKTDFSWQKRKLSLYVVVGLIIIVGIFSIVSLNTKNHRTESYKDATGAAGLDATIAYACQPKSCNEHTFDFNVYIFDETGQQVSVVRPDKEGKVRSALPEGDYVMLIGKQLGESKPFPQELLSLKNGKTLELKLKYR